ncbi:hypothetical protein H0G86_007792 [Trichoderma simmonsii]|uniref:Uncharacterized protein n=1 Tax=Trichoderma simmonsii TaxID=1491479 RepID=A0A8G0PHF9_9HYPO|nr:hypothetical protein H0G86_007792 [Trichoderma simmonsii]
MEAGISAGQGRGESTGVFRGLTLKPLYFDEQGQNKYRIRQSGCPVHIIRLHAHPMPRRAPQGVDRYWCEYIQASQKAKANRHDAAGNKQTGSRSAVQDRSSEIPFCCASE